VVYFLVLQVAVSLRPRWRRVAAPLAKLPRLLHSPHVHRMLRAVLFHGVVTNPTPTPTLTLPHTNPNLTLTLTLR